MKRIVLICILGMMVGGCCHPLTQLHPLSEKDLALLEKQVFFRDWGWRVTGLSSDRLKIQVKLENPEPQGEIKSVVALVDREFLIWSYWLFDKEGKPQYWIWDGKKKIYVRSPERERHCSRCHEAGGKNKFEI